MSHSHCCEHLLLDDQFRLAHAPLATMEDEEERMDLDLASDGDLTSCSPGWSSEEEAVRMHVLLLQASRAKPKMRRKTMTAKAKRKRFAKLIRHHLSRTSRGNEAAPPVLPLRQLTDSSQN